MSLRAQVLHGGRYVLLREGLGILVRTGGVLLLTRFIGPDQYGLFAGSFFIVMFCTALATAGLDLFLNRLSGDVEPDWYHQIYSCLLVSSVAVTALGIGLASLAGDFVNDDRIVAPLQVLMLSIPLNILWIPARSKLERAFQFRPLTISEVGADVVQYLIAIGLAVAGFGVWAAVWGFVARQGFLLVSSHILARYLPRWRWRRAMLKEIYSFGAPMCAIAVARRAGDLVITLVVGRYLGATGIGVVALAVRLIDTASFVSRATVRLSVVALGRVQKDLPRLKAAVEEGMTLQVLTVGPVLVGMSMGVWLVLAPLLGPQWQNVTGLVPYISVAYLVLALLTIPQSALMVLGRRWSLAVANIVSTALFFGAAFILVPRMGIVGYGLAQIISLVAQWQKTRQLRQIAGVQTRRAIPWFVAWIPPLFVPLLPWYLALATLLPLVVLLVLPGPRGEIARYIRAFKEVSGRRTDGETDLPAALPSAVASAREPGQPLPEPPALGAK